MGFIPSNPVTIVPQATYYKVIAINISTPNVAMSANDSIVVVVGAFDVSSNPGPMQTSQYTIVGTDLAALMATVPKSGQSLYAAVKAAAYGYLQSKGLLPAGVVS